MFFRPYLEFSASSGLGAPDGAGVPNAAAAVPCRDSHSLGGTVQSLDQCPGLPHL